MYAAVSPVAKSCTHPRHCLVCSEQSRQTRRSYEGILDLRGSKLWDYQNAKITYVGCLGLLCPLISALFTLEICVTAWNRENSLKPLYWEIKVVQDHRCWYLLRSQSALFVMINNNSMWTISVQPFSRQTNQVYSGKIDFLGAIPFDAIFWGKSVHPRQESWSQKTRNLIYVAIK